MVTASAPVKVDVGTDQLISHAVHFLGKSKKDVVDTAIREYIDNHRDEINAGVQAALRQLDGSSESAISLLTDVPVDQLQDHGGMPDASQQRSPAPICWITRRA
ncbi:hypothetical protein [Actinoplanes solisilvae]|uniref:hypothetical protein n=1 Tax=Actinoplanes solisilvae TaxID=2486853 RepID=UPI000FD9B573|nr:hypothetical protein [Actinoplanes solisilvae]